MPQGETYAEGSSIHRVLPRSWVHRYPCTCIHSCEARTNSVKTWPPVVCGHGKCILRIVIETVGVGIVAFENDECVVLSRHRELQHHMLLVTQHPVHISYDDLTQEPHGNRAWLSDSFVAGDS